MKKKLTQIIIFAALMAMPSVANATDWHRGFQTDSAFAASDNDSSKILGAMLSGGLACAVGAALAVNDDDRGVVCGIVGVSAVAFYFIIDGVGNFAPGFAESEKTRWHFDGGDGIAKMVYPLSDSAQLSFGARGKALDYDGVQFGVKYAF